MTIAGMQEAVDAAAAEQGFGDRVGIWDAPSKSSAKFDLGCAGVLLVVAVILLIIAWVVTGFDSLVVMVPLALLVLWFVGMGIKGLIALARSDHHGVFLYRTGLIRTDGQRISEVIDLRRSRVTEEGVQRYRKGMKSGQPLITFTIDGPHGTSRVKGDANFNQQVLPAIKQTAAEARLPEVTEALQRGEEVPFGELTLTATGFRVAGAEPTPYPEINTLTTSNGLFEIAYGTVNQRTHSQPIGRTPDFVVLASLLAGLSGKAWT